ncbi:PTS fructose transporter subunit IIA [bacterium]|nr:MAG: PTS fructose transporter subunit IIA [bacterium]
MLLSNLINERRVIPEVKGKTKEEVLSELVHVLKEDGVVKDEGEFLKKIKERESIESTAIGDGIAIPHARSETVEKIAIALGRSTPGIEECDSMDGKPVHLVIMIAAPKGIKKEYLQTIAKVARLLRSRHYRNMIMQAKSEKEIIRAIVAFDEKYPEEVRVKTRNGRVIHRKEEK